ncbi:MAG: protein kinase domain-containing protein [Xanthobacteraceae bacterium]
MTPLSSIAHYRITSKIGAGGMGEVYRATDTKLGRDVALKVLPAQMAADPDRLARFRREARAVATLNHPHIVTIFSVEEADGIHFLTMELVEGQTLDRLTPASGLPVDRIIEIAAALSDALVAAHEKGIVHRDLKPANVMVTTDGRVKVLDFGLAKDMRADDPAGATQTSAGFTAVGVIMGTPSYMSPEQIAGRELDHRTDIFSLGIILYEMASGRRPFEGASSAELASAILRDTPRPLSEIRNGIAPELCRLIQRCLEKNAQDRFPSAREVREGLETLRRELESGSSGLRSPGSGSRPLTNPAPSIAVLPFVNRSGDADNEFFSDGLSEDLINALSRLPGLQVASRTSAFRFRGSDLDIRQIGRQLEVATVVEGSVRRAGTRLRITAQLVNAENGYQLWSERYDRQMADVFEIQDEIVASIVKAVVPALLGDATRAVERPTDNTEAYELYLKGRHYWHQRSPSTLRVAIQCFEQAIKIDPQYALAYAGLADCYAILRVYGWVSAEDGQPPAYAAMTQAVTIAPSLWEANYSRAMYTFYFEHEWREAEQHFAKAVAINPRSSLAQAYFGLFLATAGRAEDAIAHTSLACQMDPLSAFTYAIASGAFYTLGRHEEAAQASARSLELQPDYLFGLWVHGLALCGTGRNHEGIEALERAVTLSRAPIFVGNLGFAYGRAGQIDAAIRLLRELEERSSRGEFVPEFTALAIHAGLGDVPAIRRSLSKTLQERTPPVALSMTGCRFQEAFRSDPEIDRLLLKLYGR